MASETTTRSDRPLGSLFVDGRALDATVAVLSLLMVAGIGLDARAHANGISFAEEGFLTPEHVFFYTMFLGIAGVIGLATYRAYRAGAPPLGAIPDGYRVGALGVVLFGLGGLADAGWHSTFGFEQNFDVLVSPSHLLLASGAVLFLASPLRASYRRDDGADGPVALPAVVSAGLLAAMFALFGGYANPIAYTAIWAPEAGAGGFAGFVVFPAVLVGVGLALVRGFDLPAGSLAACFAFPGAMSVTIGYNPRLALAPVVAGLVGGVIVRQWGPLDERPLAMRAFGAAIGLSFAVAYVGLAASIRPIGWSVHAWPGAVATAGLAGLLVTYVARPDGRVDPG